MVDFQERDTRFDGTSAEDADDGVEEASPDENAGDEDRDDHQHDAADHDHHAHDRDQVGVGILTVSSTRTLDDDPSGDAIAAAFEADGHEVVTRELVGDDFDTVQGTVDALVGRTDVDVVVTTGGTGVSPDDVTVEAVRPLFSKDLPGFGELFRRESFEEVGTKVVGTRTVAGIADGVPVFALPGSEDAATLGTAEIILPEIGHLVGLAMRGLDDDEE